MAQEASKYLFLCILFVLTICSSGTLVGLSHDARENNLISSPVETISFLKLNKVSPSQIRVFVADFRALNSLSNTSVPVYLYLNQTQVENLKNYQHSSISGLKTHLKTFLPKVKIKSIIVSFNIHDLLGENELHMLLSTLKSLNSILRTFHLENQVKVSVSLPLAFLENLNRKQERDLHRILNFIKKENSFFIIEASVHGEFTMGDPFVESVIRKATSAAPLISHTNVSMVLTVKGYAIPSAEEVAELGNKISKSLGNSTQITGLFVELSLIKQCEQKELKREEEQIFRSSQRELVQNLHVKTTKHDILYPPTTTFPTTPMTNPATMPITVPPENVPTPTIVTVPSTNPVTVTPNYPGATPFAVPSTTPVSVPSPVPVTNPVTTPSTGQPVTNPVTTYPAPTGGVPVTTPVTNPVVAPPGTTNAPAIPGQSWCVAKTGASEAALQSALDYACGLGGADCSTIQQTGSCFNPSTLQNHASYAFNSYYQKNPVQTSCDFGGTAMITNINPSTGSCIFPSSSSPTTTSPTTPATTPTTTYPTPIPTTTTPTPTPTTTSPGAVPSLGSPPTVLNTSNPASGITTFPGDQLPPGANTSTAMATGLKPFICCFVLVTSMVTGKFILGM